MWLPATQVNYVEDHLRQYHREYVRSHLLLSCEHYKLTTDRHFSGFSRAGHTDKSEEWHDKYYVQFGLAKPSPKTMGCDNDPAGWTW